MSGSTLRVATINLLNDPSRWRERSLLLVDQIKAGDFDLIALQEVVRPLADSSAHWLAAKLGGYSVHVSPKRGRSQSREGIAILSRHPVLRHEILDLQSQERTAHRIETTVVGRPVAFANGHFHWSPGFHKARTRQVERLLAWLEELSPETAVIVAGDFNGTPESPAMALMTRHFASAHVVHHGREPEFTCPTPLVSGGRIKTAITNALMRQFSNREDGPWRGVLDYLLIGPFVRVVDCDVFLNQPAPNDPTLYASDHFGVAATCEIHEKEPSSTLPLTTGGMGDRPPAPSEA